MERVFLKLQKESCRIRDRTGERGTEKHDGKASRKPQEKHIRVLPDQWERLEKAAEGSLITANQLVIELAMEALNRRAWLSTEAQIQVARASLFAAQAIARDLIASGRENQVQKIREFISTIVPDVDREHRLAEPAAHQSQGNRADGS